MRIRGIHYDVGTRTIEGASTRPALNPDVIDREMADIGERLHANAVRVTGGELDLLEIAGRAAGRLGLEVWLSPMVPDGDAAETLEVIEDAATIAEDLRRDGYATVLVVGCELSAFMAGIVPGDDQAARLALLADLPRLISEVTGRGLDPQATFDAFLAAAVRTARPRFQGPLTYAAGAWEHVDWSEFDLVGIDAYRDATDRDRYLADLRSLAVHAKPVVVTECGCATFTTAPDMGSLAWTVVDRAAEPRRIRDGIVRDEGAQATEIATLLELIDESGADGAFLYTYIAPSYPSNHDPALDLDTASFALMRTWPDGTVEPKEAVSVVAAAYGRSPAPA